MSNKIPSVVFKNRVRGESVAGKNPWQWVDVSAEDIFSGKNIVIFSLPAAFTSPCSTAHWQGYETKYEELQALGIDEVYFLCVKAPFAMHQLVKNLGINNIKMLPDIGGNFTKAMGMLVKKGGNEMSWRYSAHVVNSEIKQIFSEEGMIDDCPGDPLERSDVDTMISYLKGL